MFIDIIYIQYLQNYILSMAFKSLEWIYIIFFLKEVDLMLNLFEQKTVKPDILWTVIKIQNKSFVF